MFFQKLKNFVFDIRVAWVSMIIFLISFFTYVVIKSKENKDDTSTNDQKGFFHFGPDKNTKFINMKLDNWEKVKLMYFFCFLITFMSRYYEGIMDFVIYSTVWNPAYKEPMKISKFLTSIFLLSDPIIWWIQSIIAFYILSIRQFQFLIPGLLGTLLSKWPYSILRINEKKYL